MPQPPPVSPPPVSADCQTSLHPAQPAAPGAPPPPPTPWKMLRSADGQTRLDFGNQSVISNPAKGQAIVLDHLKKEAIAFPIPKAPPGALPPIPGLSAPSAPGAPSPPTVQNLGKKLIDGHEVEGKLFTIPAPPIPKPPSAPGIPKGLAIPKGLPIPQAKPPQVAPPSSPKLPQTVETWTSTKFHMPVLTTVTGSFGKQVSQCKCSSPGPPPPASTFQVPPGYKLITKTL